MRRANLIQAGCLAAMAVGGRADDVVFVTDIEIWTMLVCDSTPKPERWQTRAHELHSISCN